MDIEALGVGACISGRQSHWTLQCALNGPVALPIARAFAGSACTYAFAGLEELKGRLSDENVNKQLRRDLLTSEARNEFVAPGASIRTP